MSDDKLVVRMNDMRLWLESPERLSELRKVLPEGMTPERFVRTVMTAHLRKPELVRCSLESKWLAIMDAASIGLELDGRMAHLVPFGNIAQLIVDYKGLIQAAYKNPRVLAIYAEIVCKNDPFKVILGTSPRIIHENGEPRGDLQGAYAAALIRGGGRPFVYMDRDEIEAHRARSRAKDSGPWTTDYAAMAKKTAVKQLAKFIPQSAQLMAALGHEEAPEEAQAAPYLHVPATASVESMLDAIAGEEQPLP